MTGAARRHRGCTWSHRVRHGVSGNVCRTKTVDGEDQEVAALCAHPELQDRGLTGQPGGYLPTEDCLAAQALALMTGEERSIATADVH